MSVRVNTINTRPHSAHAKLLALGVCIATGLTSPPSLAFGQTCDACVSKTPGRGPTCGCELPNPMSPKRCAPTCAPKLSFAQKFLRQLDRMGDEIECKLSKSGTKRVSSPMQCAAHCDHSRNTEPNCGCESCVAVQVDSAAKLQGVFATPPKVAYPFPDNPQQHAIGSIGDQLQTPVPSAKPAPTARTYPTMQPDGLPPVERVPLPTPSDENLPDVLVDPFKDDPSATSEPISTSDIQLTSGRRTSKLGYKPKTTLGHSTPPSLPHVPSLIDVPSALTPAQRDVHPLEFESTMPIDSTSSQSSMVIPSAFHMPVPVKSIVRRNEFVPSDADGPSVKRVRVPSRKY